MEPLKYNVTIIIGVFFVLLSTNLFFTNSAEASCGSSSCFLTVGNQPSAQPKGLTRVDLSYSYIPQTGPQNRVAAIIPEQQRQVLDEHQEFSTLSNRLQMDINHGITDNFTIHLTVPVIFREHDHFIEVGVEPESGPNIGQGVFENWDTAGLGDIRLQGKYAFLPNLRSLAVFGVGMVFPTGNFQQRNIEGVIQEPTLQAGRGGYGVLAGLYQAYELIPHKLNQFFFYNYEHTFENKFDYQFGDTHIISGGLNWLVLPNLTLSGQLNYRYRVKDLCLCNLEQAGPVGESNKPIVFSSDVVTRNVRNSGSTALMFTPGLILDLGDNTNYYFYSQVPLVRDFNGALAQGVSFLTGFVKFFQFEALS